MVTVISIAALQLVNVVRTAQFNENMVGGSLFLLAQRLRQDPAAIDELSARFDADIRIIPLSEGPDDEYQRDRLARGQVLIDSANEGSIRKKKKFNK